MIQHHTDTDGSAKAFVGRYFLAYNSRSITPWIFNPFNMMFLDLEVANLNKPGFLWAYDSCAVTPQYDKLATKALLPKFIVDFRLIFALFL